MIKGLFHQGMAGIPLFQSCMARNAIRSVENAVLIAFNGSVPKGLVLRTDNGPQYISSEFRHAMKLLSIKVEYIQKHTPEDNGDIESFHNSIKTDYNWPNEFIPTNSGTRLELMPYWDGVPLKILQQWIGHSSVFTTSIYTQIRAGYIGVYGKGEMNCA
ncbi:MAG: hypothetical protein M1597_01635 [Candidatus Thermoplasmatota archaeon]|nr:hypothetical protein [Candidatus Thermoplasmatota archaeon]